MARSIMVVDDEERIADTLALILRMKGYDASCVYDAEAALDRIAVQIPDLVISDIVMPGMSGIDLAREIEKSYGRCRVLLFSGQAAASGLLQEARDQGHHYDVLAKPIHPETLLRRVEEALNSPSSSDISDRCA